ncbi:MAG TPA: NAD(P)-dependent oxidoreductase [Gemmatimonadaceae bacterium]|nr:NAD(P)-dependent oxidoreductase [Gemmatimonadaceae bacterium]
MLAFRAGASYIGFMSDSRTALVTGGTGFIGSHLVAELLSSGWDVRCVVRPSSNLKWLDGKSIQPVTADITDPDSVALKKALEGVSAVFHFAGITSSATDEGYARVNTEGTRRIVNAMDEVSPDAHLISCSSLAAAGPVKGRKTINETDAAKPMSLYGKSKLAAEGIVEESGLKYAIVRPPVVYGPRDKKGVFSLFRFVSHGIAPRLTSATQKLSIVHVSDLVRGILQIADGDGRGIYYMTDGPPHTWDEVIGTIGTALRQRPRVVEVSPGIADAVAKVERLRGMLMGAKPFITPDRLTELMQSDWTCSDARARLDLEYEPKVTLAEGIQSTADWYRSAGWLAK